MVCVRELIHSGREWTVSCLRDQADAVSGELVKQSGALRLAAVALKAENVD